MCLTREVKGLYTEIYNRLMKEIEDINRNISLMKINLVKISVLSKVSYKSMQSQQNSKGIFQINGNSNLKIHVKS